MLKITALVFSSLASSAAAANQEELAKLAKIRIDTFARMMPKSPIDTNDVNIGFFVWTDGGNNKMCLGAKHFSESYANVSLYRAYGEGKVSCNADDLWLMLRDKFDTDKFSFMHIGQKKWLRCVIPGDVSPCDKEYTQPCASCFATDTIAVDAVNGFQFMGAPREGIDVFTTLSLSVPKVADGSVFPPSYINLDLAIKADGQSIGLQVAGSSTAKSRLYDDHGYSCRSTDRKVWCPAGQKLSQNARYKVCSDGKCTASTCCQQR